MKQLFKNKMLKKPYFKTSLYAGNAVHITRAAGLA